MSNGLKSWLSTFFQVHTYNLSLTHKVYNLWFTTFFIDFSTIVVINSLVDEFLNVTETALNPVAVLLLTVIDHSQSWEPKESFINEDSTITDLFQIFCATHKPPTGPPKARKMKKAPTETKQQQKKRKARSDPVPQHNKRHKTS